MISADLTGARTAIEVTADIPAPQTKSTVRRPGRKNSDMLGLAWLHGTLQAAVFRRQVKVSSWESPTSARTLEEFESGLDLALATLDFAGSEAFLILEHDQFVHQAEHAPAFSESAARAYLRGRVQRYEKDREPVMWVGQRTVSVRQESAFLLHLLPTAFYRRLSNFLLARHLDLTRILPLAVPLQLLREATPADGEKMVLMAAEAGDATTLVAARSNGELLFSRTMLGRWDSDPARIAVEVNRSLLYAKQQFGTAIDRIELLGAASEQMQVEVRARCGAEKELLVRPANVSDWLQAIARLSPRHPTNLVVGYLGRKRRRQFTRRALVVGCWLALALMALNSWTATQDWKKKNRQLSGLQAKESKLTAERDELRRRNSDIVHYRELIRQAADERLPAVAPRFLAFLGGIRSADTQFTEFQTKWDPATGKWTFRLEGLMDGDEETARETLATLQRTIAKSALRGVFNDTARTLMLMPAAEPGAAPVHRFSLEGGLFEN